MDTAEHAPACHPDNAGAVSVGFISGWLRFTTSLSRHVGCRG